MTRTTCKHRLVLRAAVCGGVLSAALAAASSDDTAALFHYARLHVSPELVMRYLDAPPDTSPARACERFVETRAGRRALLEQLFEGSARSDLRERIAGATCGVMTFDANRLIAKAHRPGYGTLRVLERGHGVEERLFRLLSARLPEWCGETIAVDKFPVRLEVLAVADAVRRYEESCGELLRGDPGPFWPCEAGLFWEGANGR